MTDLSDLFGPPLALLLNPRPRYRVPAIRVGACICVLALILSSFAKTVRVLPLSSPLDFRLTRLPGMALAPHSRSSLLDRRLDGLLSFL